MNVLLEKKCPKEFSPDIINVLSAELNLHPVLIELLLSRGLETPAEINRFLRPDKNNLYDPFLMKGMSNAVKRLQKALVNKEKIVIYGDYDVDGITSAAILALFFKSNGLDVYVHIPSRAGEGYGLSVASIENIVENYFPDLILTCDCGISGTEEVAYAQELGVDVIVTDHHEPGESIPDCIVVNPKQDGCLYPDKYLCGAGVAFKLVQAMSKDESFLDFVDLACVATVADLVPLQNENRLIVQLGLKRLSSGCCNVGLKMLLDTYCGDEAVTSGDIAYKIAPRLNAAGRIGDAFRAFQVLISDDKNLLLKLIEEIENDNTERKKLCDKIYEEAVCDLQYEDLTGSRAIVLCNAEWSKGVTGIAAARLAGEYNRPAFIIVDANENGVYKGTARSIRDINIHEILAECSDLLVEYGGHSGAAGFSIEEKNIPHFKAKVNDILKRMPEKLFLPVAPYDLELPLGEITKALLSELSLIEPTGNSNTKPLFKICADKLNISPCKNASHTSVVAGSLQMYAFNYTKKNQLLAGSGKKEIVVELTDGPGNSVNAYIKAVSPAALWADNEIAVANYLLGFKLEGRGDATYKTYSENGLAALLPDNIYGTLLIFGSMQSYSRFVSRYGEDKLVVNSFLCRCDSNNYSGAIISPQLSNDFALSNYNKIVFVDSPVSNGVISYFNEKTKAEIYIPEKNNCSGLFSGLSVDREEFGKYYNIIKSTADCAFDDLLTYYKRVQAKNNNITAAQFVFCFMVFEQLGFVSCAENKLTINRDVKKPLSDSQIFNLISEYIRGNNEYSF